MARSTKLIDFINSGHMRKHGVRKDMPGETIC